MSLKYTRRGWVAHHDHSTFYAPCLRAALRWLWRSR